MVEEIQLPKHKRYSEIEGVYILQFKNAVQSGYPKDWQFSHMEWLSLERFGLIKIGVTKWNIYQRRDDASRRAWNFNNPDIIIAGYVDVSMRHTYEVWIHQTLHNYRIPQRDMDVMGREWFVPSNEVLGFLQDVMEQLKNEGKNQQEVERTFDRLAQIRQAYFGGRLNPPIKASNDYFPEPFDWSKWRFGAKNQEGAE